MLACPNCSSEKTVKNSRIHNGKQRFKCHDCGRQFVEHLTKNDQKKGRLTIQCDELWSFVDKKGNKQWVWLALDADTREIVGVHIGGLAKRGTA